MKGKGTIIVTIGAMTALLVCVMLMQFRTIEETDIEALETMRETELRAELSSWKTKYEEASKLLEETKAKISEYEQTMANNEESSKLLKEELNQAMIKLGKTDVTGSGIVVTLKDNDMAYIDAYDLYKLVNELRLAGAEAISINDIRITAMTDIKWIANGLIRIDSSPVTSPYVIKAIGDQTYLESGLTLKTYGYMDYVIKSNDKTGVIERQDNITIKASTVDMTFEYAEEVKKQ